MAFVRKKKIGGEIYSYLVESYRDPQTGKVKQRHIKYLGKVGAGPMVAAEPAVEVVAVAPIAPIAPASVKDFTSKDVRVGDWVEFRPERGIAGRWQVLAVEPTGRMRCQAELGCLPMPGFWVAHVARVLPDYLPLGTTVRWGAREAVVVPGSTIGEDGARVGYEKEGVVQIAFELDGTRREVQVPRENLLVA